MSCDPQRILIRLPNWTGDVVMATPGLRALRARYPAASITAQLRPGLEPLLAGLATVDSVIAVRSWRRGPRALLREARSLRERRFDLGVCLPDSWSSALLMRTAGVRDIAGFRRAGRGWLLHQPVAPRAEWGRRRWVARERYVLHLLEAIGCPEQGSELELRTTPEEEEVADRLLEPLGARAPFVALAPGASFGSAKRWAPESFGAVADALAAEGVAAVIVGSMGEAALGRAVGRSARSRPIDLSGRTDLGALKAVLRRASAVVCNDAGARHIATAFGTPAIVLFGPTALEKTDCNLATVQVVDAIAACRPCQRRDCPIDHRCMTRIEPARVVARTLAVL
jgi:heptosyltransferase-2